MIYRNAVRPLLFQASKGDPERGHELVLSMLSRVGKYPHLLRLMHRQFAVRDSRLEQSYWGERFVHPVGLAAGFDKNGVALHGLEALGFSFIEMGTVTPLPQNGNPRPRMFRLERDRALINRMGFNNSGSHAVKARLERTGDLGIPLGVSLGKGRDTPLEKADDDYKYDLACLHDHGEYFAVNASSPNTPGLRQLLEREHLARLTGGLGRMLYEISLAAHRPPKPFLVKITSDLGKEELNDVGEVVVEQEVAGVIAVNTTVSRDGLRTQTNESGGLSGAPLLDKAIETVRYLRYHLPPEKIIIGVGGIFTGRDAYSMFQVGANLIQVYTSFIYEGPSIVCQINRGILALMERDRIPNLSHFNRPPLRL